MKTSESLSQLATALAAAQGEMEVAKKDNTNTFFAKGATKAKYADINNVWIACRASLSKHGLCVLQAPSVTPERFVRLTTRLIHKSGEWVEVELDFKSKEDTPQAIGSCITYARRYSLASLVGVVAEDEDDDGNSASLGPNTLKKHNQQNQKQPQANGYHKANEGFADVAYNPLEPVHKNLMFQIFKKLSLENEHVTMKHLSEKAANEKIKTKDLEDFVQKNLLPGNDDRDIVNAEE